MSYGVSNPHKLSPGLSVVYYLLWMFPTFVVIPGVLLASVLRKGIRSKALTINLIVALFAAGIFHIMLLFVDRHVFLGRFTYSVFQDDDNTRACVAQLATVAGIEHLVIFCLIGVIRDARIELNILSRSTTTKAVKAKIASQGRTWVTVLLVIWPWIGYVIIAAIIAADDSLGGGLMGESIKWMDLVWGGDGGLPYCGHGSGDLLWIFQTVNTPLYIAAIVMIVLVIRSYTQVRAQVGTLTFAEDSWFRWFCICISSFIVVMMLDAISWAVPGQLKGVPTILFALAIPPLVMCVGWRSWPTHMK